MLSLRTCLFRTLRCAAPLRGLASQGPGVMRWRYLSSDSGATPFTEGTEPVATQWNSPTVDDIHLSASHPVTTINTGKPFSEFVLDHAVVQRLVKMGFSTAFEIQDKTLPLTLEGRDVIGRAITGSGKTLAFALPIIHTLSKSRRGSQPRALVITPTRELCQQVTKSIQSLSDQLRCISLYGGVPYGPQEKALRDGVDVVCATPGRLNDHLERRNFGINNVQFLILDEADELLTPNFKEQIKTFLEDCPKSKQMMLFSATLPRDIKEVVHRYMNDPVMVDLVSERSLVPDSVVHELETTAKSRMKSSKQQFAAPYKVPNSSFKTSSLPENQGDGTVPSTSAGTGSGNPPGKLPAKKDNRPWVVALAVRVPYYRQLAVVADLLLIHKPRRAIVFTPTRVHTRKLSSQLNKLGLNSQALNSDFSQHARELCLNEFRSGLTNILVATDVAARGIDVPETDLVIQVEPPPNGIDYYIHRTGRTGRKGQPGLAILVYSGGDNRNGMNADDLFRQIKRSKIPIKHVRPPSGRMVMEAAIDDTVTRIKGVDPTHIEVTRPHAEKLIADDSGVDTLAAALALLSHVDVRKQEQRHDRGRYHSEGGPRQPRRRRHDEFDDDMMGGQYRNSGFRRSHNPVYPSSEQRSHRRSFPPDRDSSRKGRDQDSYRRDRWTDRRFTEERDYEDF